MKFYSFDDIRHAADCRDIARDVYGCEIKSGRTAAKWRDGANQSSVTIDKDQWYDHGAGKCGGGAIELAAIRFGGDKQAAQEWLGERYGLKPRMVTGEAPARGESRYDKLVAEGWREVARYEYRGVDGGVKHVTVRMERGE